jgi:nucleoid-associated protein YgaU
MGLIDFVKNVGKKLDLNKDDDKPQQGSQGQHPQNPAQAKPAAAAGPTPQQVAQTQERKREAALVAVINQMGFKVRDLAVDIEGDKALVRGAVDTQEEREKVILLTGNTDGIASVDDRIEVSRPEPEAQYYDVKPGDSLSKIAKQFYGDANKYNLIFEANRPLIKDADDIYPGQKLRIPAAATAGVRA